MSPRGAQVYSYGLEYNYRPYEVGLSIFGLTRQQA
ncbi:hypothetical protein GA0115260_117773, partial [Streptomyces sp. MnatMP-M27]